MAIRTPARWAIAIRRSDGGIHTEAHDVHGSLPTLPFVRGAVGLVQAIRVGLDAIRVSVRVTTGAEARRKEIAMTLGSVAATFLVLFVAGPGIALGASRLHGVAAAAAEAVVRAAMFAIYLMLVSGSRSATDLFRYHGAEHKVIAAFETTGTMPSIDNARRFSPIHDRCGTTFASLFVIVAGFVYAPVPRAPLWVGAIWRVVLVPLVAAIAYEVMRLAAREHGEIWSRVVTWPGRAAQRLTTREPTDAQLEVARAALEGLLAG